MGSFKSIVAKTADKIFNIEPPKPPPAAPAPAPAPVTAPPAATGTSTPAATPAAGVTASQEAAATGVAKKRKPKTVTRMTGPLGIPGEADTVRKTLLGM